MGREIMLVIPPFIRSLHQRQHHLAGIELYFNAAGGYPVLSFSGKTCVGLGEQEEEEDGEHPDEIYCWQLPFTILGGTGAFEGAMGEGTTNDCLCSVGNSYYHVWESTVTLQKKHFAKVKDIDCFVNF